SVTTRPMARKRRIGITTTVPLEPFLAAGVAPVDLNNLFIASDMPVLMVEEAQVRGFPRNICTWIKGLYTASADVDSVVGVIQGDCSNTGSLLQTLKSESRTVHPFSYPYDRSRDVLVGEIEGLCDFLGCTIEEAERTSGELQELRSLALEIDDRRWRELSVSVEECHQALISTSDLGSDPVGWEARMRNILEKKEGPDPRDEGIRLGYIGVPPIITDLFTRIEGMGGNTVLFEVQRQFAMPYGGKDWIGRYLAYTYPYDISGRVEDIRTEVERRGIEGIVHYVQSFCHRQIDDIIFRKELDVPILTLEGNLPGPMDERTVIRLEAFLDVLQEGG
ncbi:MAG: 2-hydroxyacyl-CoA dehydratase, partial [Candidatus Thermoplasmatota archaeon]|nr:2-hydroxyacyl-CoA dehydratase [Candidatus Thermoplasmatota archaeon]